MVKHKRAGNLRKRPKFRNIVDKHVLNMASFGSGDHKIFVGGVPYDVDAETLKREVREKWKNVVDIAYRGARTGWATVEFSSKRKRDEFLVNTELHFIHNKFVDCKPYGKKPAPSSSNYYNNNNKNESSGNDCKAFIGAIPIDASGPELKKEIFREWKNVIDIVYYGPGNGWANVEFTSKNARDEFLANKSKHKILNKIVDVKPYDKKKASGYASTSISNSINSSSGVGGATATIPKRFPSTSKQSSPEPEMLTAVVTSYILDGNFGILRSESKGNGFFHADCVSFCSLHKYMCKEAQCSYYRQFTSHYKLEDLMRLLPTGTQVHLHYKEGPGGTFPYTFQASVLWPALSSKPRSFPRLSDEKLNENVLLMIDYECEKAMYNNNNNLDLPRPFTSSQVNIRNLDDVELDTKSMVSSSTGGNLSVSQQSQASSSCWEGNEQENNIDGLDSYLDGIDKFRNFFIEQFKFTNRDPKALGMGNLATKIMTLIRSNLSDDKTEMKAIVAIHMFIGDSQIVVEKSKFLNILANFKVLFRNVAYKVKKSANGVDSSSKSLAIIAQRLKKGQEGENNSNCSDNGSSNTEGGSRALTEEDDKKDQNSDDIDHDDSFDEELLALAKNEKNHRKNKEETPENWTELATSTTSNEDPEDGSRFNETDISPIRSFSVDFSNHMLNSMEAYKLEIKHYRELIEFGEELFKNKIYTKQEGQFGRAICLALNKKSLKSLKQEMKHMASPRMLMREWTDEMEEAWRQRHPNYIYLISPDILVKTCFLFTWKSLKVEVPSLSYDSFTNLGSLLLKTPIKSETGNLMNYPGVVTKIFNEDMGIIQTVEGKVLFNRNIVFFRGTASNCIGAYVTLNAGKVAVKANNEKNYYYFATRVWMYDHMDRDDSEPPVGVALPGGTKYWHESTMSFQKIVINNMSTLVIKESQDYWTQYNEAFTMALRENFKTKCKSVNDSNNTKKKKKTLALRGTFQPFLTHRTFRDMPGEEFSRMEQTISVLEAQNISLFDLRRDFIGKTLLGVTPLFSSTLEKILLSSSRPDNMEYFEMFNVVPLLADFFSKYDAVAEGQLQERRKVLEKSLNSDLHLNYLLENVQPLLIDLKNEDLHNNDEKAASVPASPEPTQFVLVHQPPIQPFPVKPQQDAQPVVLGQAESVVPVETEVIDLRVDQRKDVASPATVAATEAEKSEVPNHGKLVQIPEQFLKSLIKRVNDLEDWQDQQMKNEEILKGIVGEVLKKISVYEQDIGSKTNGNHGSLVEPSKFKQIVKIRLDNSTDIYEFSTDEEGKLNFSSVNAIFPGVNALKYELNGAIRICNQIGEMFESPDNGWGNRTYLANVPRPAGNQIPTSLAANHPFAQFMQQQLGHGQLGQAQQPQFMFPPNLMR